MEAWLLVSSLLRRQFKINDWENIMCLAVPGKITKVSAKKAMVDINGTSCQAGLALSDSVKVGDYVLMHAGYVIEKLSDEEAVENLDAIKNYSNLLD